MPSLNWIRDRLRDSNEFFGYLFMFLAFPTLFGLLFYLFVRATNLIKEGEQSSIYGLNYLTLEAVTVYAGLLIFIAILASFPLMLIVTVTRLRAEDRLRRLTLDLVLSGFISSEEQKDSDVLNRRLALFDRKNQIIRYVLPGAVMTILLLLYWVYVFAPRGAVGVLVSMGQGGTIPQSGGLPDISILGLSEFFEFLVEMSSPLTWTFLGAYFYIITALIRRWFQDDVTVGFAWRINMRLLLIFILGLLLTMTQPVLVENIGNTTAQIDSANFVTAFSEGDANIHVRGISDGHRWLWLVAFFGGFTPNALISWLYQRLSNLGNMSGSDGFGDWVGSIFSRPEIQQKIEGLSFFQADRLSDEGIASVRDLANEDVIDLLVNTRYDAQLLFAWVDQALLHAHRSVNLIHVACLQDAAIWKASDLLDIWYGKDNAAPISDYGVAEMNASDNDSLEARRDRLVTTVAAAHHLAVDKQNQDPNQPNRSVMDNATIKNLIENMVQVIETGNNIKFIRRFWENSTPDKLADAIETANYCYATYQAKAEEYD